MHWRMLFLSALSAHSSLCISLPPCLVHSSTETRYLLTERSLVLLRPREGSLVLVVCVIWELEKEWCDSIIKALVERWEPKSWHRMKNIVKKARDNLWELYEWDFCPFQLLTCPFFFYNNSRPRPCPLLFSLIFFLSHPSFSFFFYL